MDEKARELQTVRGLFRGRRLTVRWAAEGQKVGCCLVG